MNLLNANKNHMKSLLKNKWKNIIRILEIVLAILVLIILIAGPILKIIFFPAVSPFTDEEVEKYTDAINYIWTDGVCLDEYTIKAINIQADAITENDIKNFGIKDLPLSKLKDSEEINFKEPIFEINYDENISIRFYLTFDEKTTYSFDILTPEKLILGVDILHHISFTYIEDEFSVEDNYSEALYCEILLCYMAECLIFLLIKFIRFLVYYFSY